MSKRIFITGFWHETNSFASSRTGLEDFHAYQFFQGDELFAGFVDTNTEIGGVLSTSVELGFTLVPGVFAGAAPSGLIKKDAYRLIIKQTLAMLAMAGKIDGALVHLHGAAMSEDADDADAEYLFALRQCLPLNPIVVTFDLHANLSKELIATADALVGYDTYPHNDMAIRGREAAYILHRILWGEKRPKKVLRKLPFAPPPQVQSTENEPVRTIMAKMHAMERRSGIWSASIAWGFPYSDVAHLGVGILVQGDDYDLCDRLAEDLALTIWRRRNDFDAALIEPKEAVRKAMSSAQGPIVLVDVADNAGGGSPGDGTVILAELLDQNAKNAVVVLHDAKTVFDTKSLGIGAEFIGEVGGKTDNLHGRPVPIIGTIVFQGSVSYRRQGDYMTGQRIDLGEVTVIQAGGVTIMLTEHKALPFDADHLGAAGIIASEKQILVVKSAIAWQAHFRKISKGEIYVDTPGVCASNLNRFTFSKLTQEIFPMVNDVVWPVT